MKKLLSKILSIVIFLSLVLPASSTVFASGWIEPVNNALGTPDTITVSSLIVGDVVKVYLQANGGTVLAQAVAVADKVIKGVTRAATAIVSIPQLGTGAGIVYVSVTSKNLIESDRVPVEYAAEAATTISESMKATTVNNALGTSDTVKVTGLVVGDIVKVYSAVAADGRTSIGAPMGKGVAKTISASKNMVAETAATVSIPQLGTDGGMVYVSITRKGFLESDNLIQVPYFSEMYSNVPFIGTMTLKNNPIGTPDTVVVTCLAVGDIVKVYSVASKDTSVPLGGPIGTAVAVADKADKAVKGSVVSGIATVSIPQLGEDAGNVYVSLTSKGLHESSITEAVPYSSETKSTIPLLAYITAQNNALGTDDTVTVIELAVGDIVKVYSAASADGIAGIGEAIGTGVAVADKVIKGTTTIAKPMPIKATAIVKIPQIGAEAGNIYVSVTRKGFGESPITTAVEYSSEAKSDTPVTTNTTNTNNITARNQINALMLKFFNQFKRVFRADGLLWN